MARIDDKHRVAFALAAIDERPLQEFTESTVSAVKTRVLRACRELLRRAAKDPVLATCLVGFEEVVHGRSGCACEGGEVHGERYRFNGRSGCA
jgi:hypothetical protein